MWLLRHKMAFSLGTAVVGLSIVANTAWPRGVADEFTISLKEVVSDGNPGPGAGNIETSGAMDRYSLDITTATLVYFDELGGGCNILWRCQAPDTSLLFDNNGICVADPGSFMLDQVGTYTIEVYGAGDVTGTYSFTLWEVNPTDSFSISLKEVVSDGQPGTGAGNIEEAGTMDEYTFSVTPGSLVYFEELSGGCNIQWSCVAPDSSVLFNNNALCVTDPGSILLDQAGDYTITVHGAGGATGTYSFTLWEVNPTDMFAIGLEEIVSDGVPGVGAGNIEEPGTMDQYTFSVSKESVGPTGTLVFFDELAGGCNIRWSCIAPDSSALFSNNSICVTDPGSILLDQAGEYTIDVVGANGATGTYSFILWEVNPTDVFAISLDEIVSDGSPGVGAGNIEEPGTMDQYTFTVDPGTIVCFDELAGGCNSRWECRDSEGTAVFENHNLCLNDPGRLTLELGGEYTITAFGNGDATGTYSFVVRTDRVADIDGNCRVNVDDLLSVINNWGSCPKPCPPSCEADIAPPGGDCNVNVDDLLAVINQWG